LFFSSPFNPSSGEAEILANLPHPALITQFPARVYKRRAGLFFRTLEIRSGQGPLPQAGGARISVERKAASLGTLERSEKTRLRDRTAAKEQVHLQNSIHQKTGGSSFSTYIINTLCNAKSDPPKNWRIFFFALSINCLREGEKRLGAGRNFSPPLSLYSANGSIRMNAILTPNPCFSQEFILPVNCCN